MRRTDDPPGRPVTRGRRYPSVAAALALGVLAAACSSGGSGANSARGNPDIPAVTITPANGAANADPSGGITVTAVRGRLTAVSVRTADGPVPGSLSRAGTVWHSQWALRVSQAYTVTATAIGRSHHSVTATSAFRTLTPRSTFQTEIFEGSRQTYGVGMPIILSFSQPVTDKAAVEQSLQIRTSKPIVGAWYWDGNQTLDFRPRDYWPAGTVVTFTGHLNGVEGAPGVYGDHTLTQTFSIGPSLVAIANTTTHRTQIYYNGRLRYDWPISSGRLIEPTPDGTYLTIEKENPVRMIGPGYDLLVAWSVRFTFSGDYYHAAPWSVGVQGFANVSHGCVNLSPARAETYYKLAVPGDPITVINSARPGTWDNGWTEWFLSWPDYLKGSALHEAVVAGPAGSSFVNPATLSPDTATVPLQTAPPGNLLTSRSITAAGPG